MYYLIFKILIYLNNLLISLKLSNAGNVKSLIPFEDLRRCILYFAFVSDAEASRASTKSFRIPFRVPRAAEEQYPWAELREKINYEAAHANEEKYFYLKRHIELQGEEDDCDGWTKSRRISAIRELAKEIIEAAVDVETAEGAIYDWNIDGNSDDSPEAF